MDIYAVTHSHDVVDRLGFGSATKARCLIRPHSLPATSEYRHKCWSNLRRIAQNKFPQGQWKWEERKGHLNYVSKASRGQVAATCKFIVDQRSSEISAANGIDKSHT